jgi:hypothetical protein
LSVLIRFAVSHSHDKVTKAAMTIAAPSMPKRRLRRDADASGAADATGAAVGRGAADATGAAVGRGVTGEAAKGVTGGLRAVMDSDIGILG